MRAPWKTALMFGVLSYFVACAPVKFGKAPEESCGSNGVACVKSCDKSNNCTKQYTVSRKAQGLVDILIINDNSGSMSSNQKKMANAFSGFLNQLSNLQYRIGMTTTDISDVKADEHGAFPPKRNPPNSSKVQDGRLADFQYNDKIFNPAEDSDDQENAFLDAIERDETATCDANGYQSQFCPSSDERGIFAARLALERNEGGWIRPTAHMAVIILSDEDERGKPDNQVYKLESYDRWENLMSSFQKMYPAKTLSVHPIVVKDSACEAQETNAAQYIWGVIGTQYLNWSAAIGGQAGSICDSNFTSNLSNIATYVQNQAISFAFSCRPINDQYTVTFNPQPNPAPQVTADWNRMALKVNGQIPPNTTVTLQYECEDN